MGTLMLLYSFELHEHKRDDRDSLINLLRGIPAICFKDFKEPITETECGKHGDKLIFGTAEDGSHVVVREHHFALLTVDIQHVVENTESLKPEAPPYNETYIKALEKQLSRHLGEFLKIARSISCPVRRYPGMLWQYSITADERLLENDHVALVYEKTSKWQNIKIYKNREFGNVLYLDDDIMLGESDLIYTQTLLGVGRNSFKDKTVFILGGGDGGLLHELLKEEPKFVLMAEIDEEVIKACRFHMRSVCGDAMDQLDGPNYQSGLFQIRIDDCLKLLKEMTDSGKTFDYVINDLTEYWLCEEGHDFSFDFETNGVVLELSTKALSPGGKCLARGNSLSDDTFVKRFEADIRRLGFEFILHTVHVPSFRETYCFFEIGKSLDNSVGPVEHVD